MPYWAHFTSAKAFIQLEAFVVFTTCNKTRNKQVRISESYLADNGLLQWNSLVLSKDQKQYTLYSQLESS